MSVCVCVYVYVCVCVCVCVCVGGGGSLMSVCSVIRLNSSAPPDESHASGRERLQTHTNMIWIII